MSHFGTWSGDKAFPIIAPMVALLMLLAVACGAAATPTPEAAASPVPANSTQAAPTAMLQGTPAPTSPVVSPGKVTWMIGSFANERFDYTFNYAGHDYGRLIHPYLIDADVKDGSLVENPGVATKWSVSSNGLTWNITVRKGVKFQNGTEVTAEDVVWSLQHSIGPQVGEYALRGASINVAKAMDKIELAGPDQVNVTTKSPYPSFPSEISAAGSSWYGLFPKRAALHNVQEEEAYDRKPIGAGIMKLVKQVPVESMTFERFDDYYHQPKNGFSDDKRVKFATLDLKLAPEAATRVAALRAGEADIAPVSLELRKQVEAGRGHLVFGQEGTYLEVRQWGCWKPQYPCSDKRVRQALNYAIDKQIIQNQLYGGPEVMQVKGWYAVTPSTIGYSPELDPYPYDPNKARQLLAEAGYKTPTNPGGKDFGKLIVNTWSSRSTPFLPEGAQLGADYWRRELGLDVEVKVGDEVALKKATDLDETLHGQILWRDNEARLDAASSVRGLYATPDRLNRVHNEPEIFTMAQQAMAVFEPVERAKALNNLYRRGREEAHYINLGYINIPWGVGPRIATWEPNPLAIYISGLHTITLK